MQTRLSLTKGEGGFHLCYSFYMGRLTFYPCALKSLNNWLDSILTFGIPLEKHHKYNVSKEERQ